MLEAKPTMNKGKEPQQRRDWTRRRFLQQTAVFSALALLRSPLAQAEASITSTRPDPKATHLVMLGDWGTNTEPAQQVAVAEAMKRWVAANGIRAEALLMLGDNFYGELPGGVTSSRWTQQFEQMYPASSFPGPAYAVLGNHDYEKRGGNKVEAELAYARQGSRWTMPARWYSVTIPKENPLLTLICLDSNLPGTRDFTLFRGSFLLTREEQDQQQEWLKAELAKTRTTPFLALAAHHPLYTNGAHRDTRQTIALWDGLLREHQVDVYLSGHDHDLQHLEFKDHPTSFIVSGGGGAELVGWTTPPEQRGPFGARAIGFTDLELSKNELIIRHIGKDATVLYEFRKSVRHA